MQTRPQHEVCATPDTAFTSIVSIFVFFLVHVLSASQCHFKWLSGILVSGWSNMTFCDQVYLLTAKLYNWGLISYIALSVVPFFFFCKCLMGNIDFYVLGA